jgi:hypothetical protein
MWTSGPQHRGLCQASPNSPDQILRRVSQRLIATLAWRKRSAHEVPIHVVLILIYSKTRSSTPIASLFEEDNQNMTSGDESDDEDLTDASSESDWFEFASACCQRLQNDSWNSCSELANRGMNHSLLMRFSRISRHYTANYLETPGLWNRHPFVLTKV